jgi:flagellar motor switch protein FliM
MTDILSQKDAEQLLDTIETPNTVKKETGDSPKIKVYDFKRPYRFSKDHIRIISEVSETFARLMTITLAGKCKSLCTVKKDTIIQLTYEEFLRSIPAYTCLGIINPKPLKSNWVLEIDNVLTLAVLNACLGGVPENSSGVHQLTEIESTIMENIINKSMEDLQKAWKNILEINPALDRIETFSNSLKIAAPDEMVILVCFDTKIADIEGIITLCIPYPSIKPVMNKITGENNLHTLESNRTFITNASNILKTINAEYPRLYFTAEKLQKLKVNDILNFEGEKPFNGALYIDNVQIGSFEYQSGRKKHCIEIKEKLLIPKEDFFMTKPNITEMTGSYKDIKVQVITELGRTEKTLGDVQSFAEGTILELNKSAGDPVDIYANNVKIAKGEVVVIEENFCIRITELLE